MSTGTNLTKCSYLKALEVRPNQDSLYVKPGISKPCVCDIAAFRYNKLSPSKPSRPLDSSPLEQEEKILPICARDTQNFQLRKSIDHIGSLFPLNKVNKQNLPVSHSIQKATVL